MPEDILPLKHDYESIMEIDRVSKIPLVPRVGCSYQVFWGFLFCFVLYDDLENSRRSSSKHVQSLGMLNCAAIT